MNFEAMHRSINESGRGARMAKAMRLIAISRVQCALLSAQTAHGLPSLSGHAGFGIARCRSHPRPLLTMRFTETILEMHVFIRSALQR